jgi:hypothetical protein
MSTTVDHHFNPTEPSGNLHVFPHDERMVACYRITPKSPFAMYATCNAGTPDQVAGLARFLATMAGEPVVVGGYQYDPLSDPGFYSGHVAAGQEVYTGDIEPRYQGPTVLVGRDGEIIDPLSNEANGLPIR